MKGQMEMFDGFAVALYDGKFGGTFDLDEDMAKEMAFDDVVTFVVTARVGGVGITDTKTGDIKRTNTFQVVNSVALDAPMAEKLLDSLGQSVNGVNAGQLTLTGTGRNAGLAPDDDDVVQSSPVTDPVLASFLADQA